MKRLAVTIEKKEQISAYANAGADEVIAHVKGYSFGPLHAFGVDELPDLKKEAGQNGVMFTAAVNRLFHQGDLDDLKKMLENIAADTVIFQDPAVLRYVRMPAVYEPGTLATNRFDLYFWKEAGCSLVSVSPLLTKEELLAMIREGGCSLDCFGYQLMSLSARKLLTAYGQAGHHEGLNENRNLSLQEETRTGKMPVYEDAYGTCIYSDFIQEAFLELPEFLAAGLERVVIRSEFISDDVILDVIRKYKDIIAGGDAALLRQAFIERHPALPLETGYFEMKTVR